MRWWQNPWLALNALLIWLETASSKRQVLKDFGIEPSDIDEQENSCKQSAVMFETPGRIGGQMHK